MNTNRLLAVICVIGIVACGGNAPTETAPPAVEESTALVIYTVNYPLAYFAERIGGDLVEGGWPTSSGAAVPHPGCHAQRQRRQPLGRLAALLGGGGAIRRGEHTRAHQLAA